MDKIDNQWTYPDRVEIFVRYPHHVLSFHKVTLKPSEWPKFDSAKPCLAEKLDLPNNCMSKTNRKNSFLFITWRALREIFFATSASTQVKFKEENTSAINEGNEGQIHIFDFNSKIARNYPHL